MKLYRLFHLAKKFNKINIHIPIISQSGVKLDQLPFAKQVRFEAPFNAKPSSQKNEATARYVVELFDNSTVPFAGGKIGRQSITELKCY